MEALSTRNGQQQESTSGETKEHWDLLLADLRPVKKDLAISKSQTLDLLEQHQSVFYRVNSGSICYLLQRRKVLKASAGECLGAFCDLPSLAQAVFVEEPGSVDVFRASDLRKLLLNDPKKRECFRKLKASEVSIIAKELAPNLSSDSQLLNPRLKKFKTGKPIIQEGSKSDEVYVLASGRAAVIANGETVGIVREGEIFGAIAAITGEPRTATVKALNPCKVARYSANEFHQLVSDCPAVVTKMLEGLSVALVSANQKLLRG